MQVLKSKTFAIVIALLLVGSIGASMILLPSANAHSPGWTIPTYARVTAEPNPVGVGQPVSIVMWIDKSFGTDSAVTNNWRFHGYNLTIVDPNGGVNTTIFDVVNDTTSSQFMRYIPTIVGTYTIYFNFPGQAYAQYTGQYNPNSILVNDTFLPSSASTTLTVQQTQLPATIPSYPLPTNYWSRPIYGENSYWYTISSNWLGTGAPVSSLTGFGDLTGFNAAAYVQRYPGDAVGPLTGHIMWTMPLQSGGVVGGNNFAIPGNTYFEGSAYNQRYTNPIVLNGKIYFTAPVSFTGVSSGPTECVDLRTGQVLWSRTDVPALSFGYIYDVEDQNQHGVFPAILFTTNFARAFDADTGDPLFNVTGVPTGAEAMGPQGEHLRYVFSNAGTATNPSWYLSEWNSSKLFQFTGLSPSLTNMSNGAAIGVPPAGTNTNNGITGNSITAATINGNIPLSAANVASGMTTYDWNITAPYLNVMGNQTLTAVNGVSIEGYSATGANPDASNPINVLGALYNKVLLCENGTMPGMTTNIFGTNSWGPYTYFAIDINPASSTYGQILWTQTLQPPAGNQTVLFGGIDPTANGGKGVFVEGLKESVTWVGYDLSTGAKLWGPVGNQSDWDYYGQPAYPYMDDQLAYGNLYSSSYGGILYCYNLTDGNLLWTYGNGGTGNSTNSGLYTAYGNYPMFIQAVGNGVIYLASTEHTIETPIYKGALARAVNATTGAEIWTVSDYTGEFFTYSYAIADGYATYFNGIDNQIYSIGQGPSQTTVSAPAAGLSFGQPVVISGYVTDTSAGTQQSTVKADFPAGVPVSSDASMKDWMGYVYQQKPIPTNFTGVPVQIMVTDSNGNTRTIGTTTTDTTGRYSLTWTPDISGNYTVTANFAGTNGYWPSSAESGFTVMQAAASTTAPTTAPQNNASTDNYILAGIAAVIVVIIVVGAVLALMIRKRP